jgi:hypothetical protein
MKKRNREKLAKTFAFIVILVMLVQIFLPLFNSMQTNQTAASVQFVESTSEITVPVNQNTSAASN